MSEPTGYIIIQATTESDHSYPMRHGFLIFIETPRMGCLLSSYGIEEVNQGGWCHSKLVSMGPRCHLGMLGLTKAVALGTECGSQDGMKSTEL